MTTTPDLDFSTPFDRAKTSDALPAWALADSLLAGLLPDLKRSRQAYRQNMVTILLNLFTAHQHHPDLFVAYSRDKGRYKAKDGYNRLGISYACLTACMDALENAGYVDGAPGVYLPTLKRQARARATEDLTTLFEAAALDLSMVKRDFEPVVLRDDQGDRRYDDTRAIKTMRRNLERINAMLDGLAVNLPLSAGERRDLAWKLGKGQDQEDKPPFDLTRRSLYRVFNRGRFDQGGRFYGHWVQTLPKDYRRRLLFDGESVCEWDFSGMAVNMLYLREGLDLPDGDVYAAYAIPGRPDHPLPKPFRNKLLKTAMNALLNAGTRAEAVKAIHHDVQEKTGDPSFTPMNASLIISRFEDKHRPIAHHFGTGVGLALQYDDSRVAEAVVLDLMAQGIPCVPVHDSFMVAEKWVRKTGP